MLKEYTQQDIWDLIDKIIDFLGGTDSDVEDYLQELKNNYLS